VSQSSGDGNDDGDGLNVGALVSMIIAGVAALLVQLLLV